MVHMTQASHIKALMRDSAVAINLRLILVLVNCIHSYIWEYVAMRKRLSKIHICENKRLSIAFTCASLLNVYGDEFHFLDNILLEWPGNKTSFDFLFLIPNELVFYLFLVL